MGQHLGWRCSSITLGEACLERGYGKTEQAPKTVPSDAGWMQPGQDRGSAEEGEVFLCFLVEQR